jgi:hypothetical protein
MGPNFHFKIRSNSRQGSRHPKAYGNPRKSAGTTPHFFRYTPEQQSSDDKQAHAIIDTDSLFRARRQR